MGVTSRGSGLSGLSGGVIYQNLSLKTNLMPYYSIKCFLSKNRKLLTISSRLPQIIPLIWGLKVH
jgi:hypothetical protein